MWDGITFGAQTRQLIRFKIESEPMTRELAELVYQTYHGMDASIPSDWSDERAMQQAGTILRDMEEHDRSKVE